MPDPQLASIENLLKQQLAIQQQAQSNANKVQSVVKGGLTVAGVAGGASYAAGQAAGAPSGQAVGAAGALASGAGSAISAGASAGPAAGAAVGLVALAGAAKLAAESAKGFAAAASPNGLKGLDQAFTIFSAVIGGRLLPVFMMLGAGVLTAAELLQKNLAGSVDETVKMYQEWKPAFAAFGVALAAITDGLMSAAGKIARWFSSGKDPNSTAGKIGAAADEYDKARGIVKPGPTAIESRGKNVKGSGGPDPGGHPAIGPDGRPLKDKDGKLIGEDGKPLVRPGEAAGGQSQPTDPTKTGPANPMQIFDKNLKMLAKDMTASMGGKGGGIGGIEEQFKKVQQAAMGGGLDRKLLEIQKENTGILNQIAGNTGKEAKKAPPVTSRDR